MKKGISLILSIIACLIMVACDDSRAPIEPVTPPTGGTEQGGGTTGEEPTPPNGGGGNVVTPIQPGGNYDGGEY